MDTPDGETIVDHLAGVEDYTLAMATYRAAIKRWPNTPITLRQRPRDRRTRPRGSVREKSVTK